MSELNLNKAQPIGLDLSKAKPIEPIDDEIESDAPCGLAAPPQVDLVPYTVVSGIAVFNGIATFEDALPYITGAIGHLADPKRHQPANADETVGHKFLRDSGFIVSLAFGIGGPSLTTSDDEIKRAIRSYVDRKIDPSKPGPQFKMVDWQILPIDEPTKHQSVRVGDYHVETLTAGQWIPPQRATCRICSAVMPGQAPPHHDCSQYQF